MIKKIIGLGVLVSIPLLMKRSGPIKKEILKSGIKVGENIKEMTAVIGEEFEDLIAEVRMEMKNKQ